MEKKVNVCSYLFIKLSENNKNLHYNFIISLYFYTNNYIKILINHVQDVCEIARTGFNLFSLFFNKIYI